MARAPQNRKCDEIANSSVIILRAGPWPSLGGLLIHNHPLSVSTEKTIINLLLHNHVKKLLQTDRRRVAVGLDGEHARACRKRRFPTLARGPRDGIRLD